ncbi:microsomal dipeptidase-like Zn-dependent dipeptidase [Algoriphagus sp. 4150]|uniref:dipeptidase n=1 Tax=Algoriphagus sp. 4150 TaxID=2817756 RepID=UPI002857F980|nr:membrane dipeptidase [Algoriphagus sp. 4150]MDR7128436.1 microsomal dipeptidase-like Zn-dependent dipeptidase [Algoriphagus sp. 4150]
MKFPIIDMHCDLLSYLARIPGATPYEKGEIACAIPWLQAGNVRMQILAIYTDVKSESMDMAMRQAQIFSDLLAKHDSDIAFTDADFLLNWEKQNRIGVMAAIENAAGLGNEEASWEEIYSQFDGILAKVNKLAYIGLTHHTENRFGGGNYTEGIGLKDDGKKLLDYISGKNIPIDFSHTSDLLAEGILDHIDRQNLKIPVIASHSNFREIYTHPRNLTDEFAKEIIHRGGIIGVNFLRAFLDPEVPERLFDHIFHGFQIGGAESICFGADYFYTKDFEDASRHPFYFPLVENAGKYPSLIESLEDKLSEDQLINLSYRNSLEFYRKIQN